MKKSIKIDLSWRVWSLIVGFFILLGFVGLSLAVDSSIHGHPDQGVAPVGAVMAFNLASCPDGWAIANGSTYYDMVSPDLRGTFIRGDLGEENMRDVERVLGAYQADAFAYHSHSYTYDDVYGHSNGLATGEGASVDGGKSGTTGSAGDLNIRETRPKNVALLYCIKI